MLSANAREWIEDRGLDQDLAQRYGLESRSPAGVTDGDWIAIPYYRADRVVNRKYRRLDEKAFAQDKGGAQIFWNESVLNDVGLADMPLIVTEGELDALALIQAGFQRTVSVPGGAPAKPQAENTGRRYKFIEEVLATLDRVGRIILAMDADAPGYALNEDLSTLLGPARCKFVPYPDGCKDANDVLVRFGAARLRQCVEAARWVNVAGVRKLSDYPPGSDGDPVVWRTGLSPAWDKRVGIMPGYTSVWTGIPMHGKTQLLKQVTWTLCEKLEMRAAVASFEETFNRDYKRSALHYLIGRPRGGWPNAGGPWTAEEIETAEKWIEDHIIAIDPHGYADAGSQLEEIEPTMDWVLHAAQTAIIRHQCRFVVVDPWGEISQSRERGESEHDFIGRSLTRFNRLARSLKAHVAIIAHPKKLESNRDGVWRPPGPYDIAGSSHFFNKPSLGVSIHRDPDLDKETKEPLPGSTRTKIMTWKSKFQDVQGKVGHCYLNFIPRDGRFREP